MPPPHTQSNSQEDLSVVLGRFHTWDALQKGVAPAASMQDLQEISYEEAMAARRRSGRKPMPPNTQPVVAAQQTDAESAPPAIVKVSASAVMAEATNAAVVKRAVRKPIARAAAARIAAPPVVAKPTGKRQAERSRSLSNQETAKLAASPAPKALRKEAPTFRNALATSLKASAGSGQKKSGKAAKPTPQKRATKQALQPEPAASRTISVNLRLSLAEHARLRAGAAAAGMNLAAYIRGNKLQMTARESKASRATAEKRTDVEPMQPADRAFESSTAVETRGQSLLSRMTRFLAGRHFAATA